MKLMSITYVAGIFSFRVIDQWIFSDRKVELKIIHCFSHSNEYDHASTPTDMGHFYVILFSNIIPYNSNISVWNCNAMDI